MSELDSRQNGSFFPSLSEYTLVNAGSEEISSDLIEGPVGHRVAQSQGAKVEVISEGPLGSEVHHQTEGSQADPHQLHNPGDPKDYPLR